MASSDADQVGRVLEASGRVLERARLLGSRKPVVVAVSGGADSLCLLDVMVTLLERAKRRVVVGHVDHKLRPTSAADAAHVRAASDRYGVRCEVLEVDVPALMAAERRGLEDAARMGRYRALSQLAASLGTDLVATGHTRDDSIETVLLHLLRGSGPSGLAGIAQVEFLPSWLFGTAQSDRHRGLKVIRPLVDLARADTVEHCEARGIDWITDETNADTRLLRNRLRAHLLPVLRTYNPSVDQAIGRTSQIIRDEQVWLDMLVQRARRQLGGRGTGPDRVSAVDHDGHILSAEDHYSVHFDARAWRRQPIAVQRRLVRLIASEFGVDDLGFAAVERAVTIASTGDPPGADLGGGLSVYCGGMGLSFKCVERMGDGSQRAD